MLLLWHVLHNSAMSLRVCYSMASCVQCPERCTQAVLLQVSVQVLIPSAPLGAWCLN